VLIDIIVTWAVVIKVSAISGISYQTYAWIKEAREQAQLKRQHNEQHEVDKDHD